MAEQRPLTKRQSDIYDFIRKYVAAEGISPTVKEIAAEFRFKSTNAVNDFLTALERKGRIIRKSKGISRGIVLRGNGPAEEEKKESRLPAHIRELTIIGEGHSSNPFSVFTNPRGRVTVDTHYFTLGPNSFAWHVKDDGLTAEGIHTGDLALITQAASYDGGCKVLAMINDMQILRACEQIGNCWKLTASKRGYPKYDIPFDGSAGIVLGRLVGILKKEGGV